MVVVDVAVLLVVEAVLVVVLLLLDSLTRAVSWASEVKEPVTPDVLVQELGRFELTPATNLTTAH